MNSEQGRIFSCVLPTIVSIFLATFALAGLAGCGGEARLQVADGTGPNPQLPPPEKSLIPRSRSHPPKAGRRVTNPHPQTEPRLRHSPTKLDHPRWLYVLPNGDVLVAETNGPERPGDNKGIKAYFMKRAVAKAGAAAPDGEQITLLRDANGDGVAGSAFGIPVGIEFAVRHGARRS